MMVIGLVCIIAALGIPPMVGANQSIRERQEYLSLHEQKATTTVSMGEEFTIGDTSPVIYTMGASETLPDTFTIRKASSPLVSMTAFLFKVDRATAYGDVSLSPLGINAKMHVLRLFRDKDTPEKNSITFAVTEHH